MKNPKIVKVLVAGNLVVASDTQFNQVKADKVIISAYVSARMYGTIGDLVLYKGARLYLHGNILGHVDNYGGELFIYEP